MSLAQMKDVGKYLNATLGKEMGRSNIFLVYTWSFFQWNALLQLDITLLPPSAQQQAQSWINQTENRRLLERMASGSYVRISTAPGPALGHSGRSRASTPALLTALWKT